MPLENVCRACGKPRLSGSMTQWLFGTRQCVCVSPTDQNEASLARNMCWTCGKPVPGGKGGTITQWIFRSDQCRCPTPKLADSNQIRENKANSNSLFATQANSAPLDLDNVQPIETFAGRYDIVSLIGEGGVGSVYQAVDRVLCKEVAIKRLHKRKLTPRQMARLQQEARAACKLHHKNLIAVLDFGVDVDEPYLVMEYARGKTLEEILRQYGALPLDTALDITYQLCQALAHAHSKGVIHCDLSSRNIMLSQGESGLPEVKVLDFGVAKYSSDDSRDLYLTEPGSFTGSPFYVSPEQCRGEAIDKRTDVYAVGCLLFEMLTGQPPYVGEDTAETLKMHISAPVPSLNEKSHGASFPEEIEQMVAQAISKNRDERFAQMDEFIAAIESVEDFEKIDDELFEIEPGSENANGASQEPAASDAFKGKAFPLVPIIATVVAGLGVMLFVVLREPQTTSPPATLKSQIEQADLGDQAVKKLTGRYYINRSEQIWFNDPQLTDTDVKNMASEIRKSAKIKDVVIDYSRGVTAERLSMLPAERLRSVSLANSDVNDAGILVVSKFPHLENLNLSGCKMIGHQTWDYITANSRGLIQLDLSNLNPGSGGLAKISSLPALQSLSLSEAQNINDETVRLLSNAKELNELYLRGTDITDDAMPELAKMQKLRFLSLQDDSITDKGLKALLRKRNWEGLALHGKTYLTARSTSLLAGLSELKFLSINESMLLQKSKANYSKKLQELWVSDSGLHAPLPHLAGCKVYLCPRGSSNAMSSFIYKSTHPFLRSNQYVKVQQGKRRPKVDIDSSLPGILD